MPYSLLTLALLLLPLVSFGQEAATTAARPNVVLIMTDDMGWADIGSYGAKDIATPNIDRLAKEGVKLTDFYANGPLCTPTRAALITGRYQQRYGLDLAIPSANNAGSDTGLAAEGRSLPTLLKNNGYVTALMGKWHLGYRPELSPRAHGYDYFFGLKGGYHDYYHHHDENGTPDLWENDTPIVMEGYTTDLITARAVEFIQQHRDRPFFINVAFNAPHWPFQRPDAPQAAKENAHPQRMDGSLTGTREDYAAMVERVDEGVGKLLQTLDRLGVAGDTIVIFTNDNGGEWLSSSSPLFHRKWTLWEGGIRVPAIIRWPSRIAPGQISGQVGITMDLTASILAATHTPMPHDIRHEGIDLLAMLESGKPPEERTLFWRTHARNRLQKAVRQGDWKLLIDGFQAFLFNVRSDPSERNDLASRHPDLVEKLRRAVLEWEQNVDLEAAARRNPGS